MPYWEDIWKLEFDMKKYKILNLGPRCSRVAFRLGKKEIRKVNNEYYIGVGLDDEFKADNNILSLVSGPNKMINWMAINFISR